MNKVYCSSCGKKIEFTVEKPKFCGSCGEPLSKIVESSKTSPSQTREPTEERDDEYYNPQEAKARARDLARNISPEDFFGEFEKLGLLNKNKPVKLKDWVNDPKNNS